MVSYLTVKCWEIMNCENPDCLARLEPEIPCWEIAKRVKAYHNISNTCRDCIVYILNCEASVIGVKQRRLLRKNGTVHQVCIVKTDTTG